MRKGPFSVQTAVRGNRFTCFSAFGLFVLPRSKFSYAFISPIVRLNISSPGLWSRSISPLQHKLKLTFSAGLDPRRWRSWFQLFNTMGSRFCKSSDGHVPTVAARLFRFCGLLCSYLPHPRLVCSFWPVQPCLTDLARPFQRTLHKPQLDSLQSATPLQRVTSMWPIPTFRYILSCATGSCTAPATPFGVIGGGEVDHGVVPIDASWPASLALDNGTLELAWVL